MKIKRPILRYHGGKWKKASWIISHFSPHRTYTQRGNASYVHEFCDQDHIDLVTNCRLLKGTVLISGYASELYTDLLSDWYQVRSMALADGARERTECLWSNRPFPNELFRHQ